jgi:hypothetical protein
MKYTLVTVAYGDDLGFMHVQARSVARYVASELLEEIIIVENGPPNLPDGWRHLLLREYGALRDKVKFVPASTLATIKPHPGGWFTQQILKLMVSKIVKTKYYLILDAKNHFIFPFTRQHIETDGKPKMFAHAYLKHPLRRYLEPILHYFKLSDENLKHMLPTTPPFYVHTALVREMIQAMVKREKRSFEEIFCRSSIRFTEFFTIGAYILSTNRKFEDYYDLSDCGYSIIWKYAAADDAAIEREINNSEKRQAPLFSVHRASFPLLTDKSRKTIAAFWQRRGLFANEADALRYLADPNSR